MQAAAKQAAAKAEEEKRSQRRWIMQYMEDQSESEDEQEQVSAAGLTWAELGICCAPWLQVSSTCSWPLMQALVYAALRSLTLWQTLPGRVQEAQSITEFATFVQLASAL